MSESNESSEKTFSPTQKKLGDARKNGDIPKSTDLSAAASYFGIILALTLVGPHGFLDAASNMKAFLANPEGVAALSHNFSDITTIGFISKNILLPITPLFAIPSAAVLLSLVAQQAILFAPSKIKPKLNKISPIASIKKKLGASGLFEFGKSTVKLIIVSFIMLWFLIENAPEIIQIASLSAPQSIAVIVSKIIDFFIIILIMSLLIGGIDYLWQIYDHHQKNMMTRKEVEDESKEAEGDPHHKQTRRQRGYEIALNQMLSDVPEAAVIIVNPTHFAVALKWDPLSDTAPICVAKGVDEIAAKIRDIAKEHSIPIHSDPVTARAIHARIDIGSPILADDYKAVAAAIRFAHSMGRKNGKLHARSTT